MEKYGMMINWHDASRELPEHSGRCIVLEKDDYYRYSINILNYSAKYKLWNHFDNLVPTEEDKTDIFNDGTILAWADIDVNSIGRWIERSEK